MKKLRPETAYWLLRGGQSLFLSMIFTVSMVYQVTVVGLSPLQLVLVGTTLEVTIFLFEVPTGVVADVYSRRLSILIGVAIIGLGFVIEGALPVFLAVVVGQALWGIGYTFTSGATQAWIVDEMGEENAGKLFLRGSQVESVSDLVGIGLGTGLGLLAVNLPILLGGAALIGLAGVLALSMPEHNFVRKTGADRNSWRAMAGTLRDGLRLVRVHPALLTIFGIGLVYGLYSEGYDRLSTAHLIQDITLPTWGGLTTVVWFGLISAAGSILSLVVVEYVRRRVDTQQVPQITRALFLLSALLCGSLLGFALTGNFMVAVGLMLAIGVIRGLIGPLYDTWVNQRLDSRVRATVLSMSSQVDAIGQIAGGPGVGWVGSTFGIRAALTASALILSPVLLLLARAVRPPTGEAGVAESAASLTEAGS